MDYKDRITAWEARNPLRMWRVEQGLSRGGVAAFVDSSTNSVINWERGGSIPDKTKMALIAKEMGIDPQVLRGLWMTWRKEIRG